MKQPPYSQFSLSSDDDLIRGDDQEFSSVSVASKPELIDALQERGTGLIALKEGLEAIRTTLEIPAEIQIGITFIRVQDAEELDIAQEFMDDNPGSLGFCFSNGFEVHGRDTLEVFVAIDPLRIPLTEYELTDELVEQTIDLNHYLISQIIMALDPDDEGITADAELTEAQVDAYEAKATAVLNILLEQEIPPFAIVPYDDEEQ